MQVLSLRCDLLMCAATTWCHNFRSTQLFAFVAHFAIHFRLVGCFELNLIWQRVGPQSFHHSLHARIDSALTSDKFFVLGSCALVNHSWVGRVMNFAIKSTFSVLLRS